MAIHILLITVFFYIIFSWPSPSLASTCVIVGKEGTKVYVNGKERGFLEVIKNCKEVELTEDKQENEPKKDATASAYVCYMTSVHAKLCEDLKIGEKKVLNNTGDFFAGLTLKISQIINPSETVFGGRRLDNDASIPGFPSGEILLPRDKLVFSVNASLLPKGLNQFSLYESGTDANPIYELKSPGGRIEIPANKLEHGKTYRWVAQSSEGSYDNTFRITTKEDQDDFEKQLAESISKTNGSPLAEGILKAEWCHEYEYFFDRDQALRKVYASSH